MSGGQSTSTPAPSSGSGDDADPGPSRNAGLAFKLLASLYFMLSYVVSFTDTAGRSYM